MSYDDATAKARALWGDDGTVWKSYDGIHFVGRLLRVSDVPSPGGVIEVHGEGDSWDAAFEAVRS